MPGNGIEKWQTGSLSSRGGWENERAFERNSFLNENFYRCLFASWEEWATEIGCNVVRLVNNTITDRAWSWRMILTFQNGCWMDIGLRGWLTCSWAENRDRRGISLLSPGSHINFVVLHRMINNKHQQPASVGEEMILPSCALCTRN